MSAKGILGLLPRLPLRDGDRVHVHAVVHWRDICHTGHPMGDEGVVRETVTVSGGGGRRDRMALVLFDADGPVGTPHWLAADTLRRDLRRCGTTCRERARESRRQP
jgi:hypothetical protein